jgi:site-specific DNA recombinase
MQDKCSIADQIRECREAIERQGWVVVEEFICFDEAKSGQSRLGRTGLDTLVAHAQQKHKQFDTIVIDDTSRFGRNLSETLPLTEILAYDGVGLYFAKQELASWDPHFRDLFIKEQRQDEQYGVKLGRNVKRGHSGRVDRGFVGTGRTYGYDNIPVEIPGTRGAYGRPRVEGVRMEKNPEEAAVVKRFFEEIAAGKSQLQVVLALNREGVPSTLRKNGNLPRMWNVQTLTRLLNNEKYVGTYIFNRRKQVHNPRTGRKELIPRPREEWQIQQRPELRIISDELWEAAHKQLKAASDRFGGSRRGGMNRTEASRGYIFSGLMYCATCDGKINIVWGKPPMAMYGCHSAKFKGTCSNRVTISQRGLQSQLLEYLAANLSTPELKKRIEREFTKQLNAACTERKKLEKQHELDPQSFERKRAELNRLISNVLDTAIAFGPSPELTARHQGLQQQLAALEPPPVPATALENYTQEQIRDFLSKKMADLAGVLGGDPELAKREMQKRITKLILTPIDTQNGRGFEVSGDLRLFAGPDDVMVNQSSPKLIDHYKAFVLPIKMMLKSPRRGEGNQRNGDHGVLNETTLPAPSPCDTLDSSVQIGA